MIHLKQDLSLKQNDPHFVPKFSEEFPAGTGRQVGLGTSCFPKGHRVASAGLPRAQASCKHKYCASAPNLWKNRPVISTEPCLTAPGGWMFTDGTTAARSREAGAASMVVGGPRVSQGGWVVGVSFAHVPSPHRPGARPD